MMRLGAPHSDPQPIHLIPAAATRGAAAGTAFAHAGARPEESASSETRGVGAITRRVGLSARHHYATPNVLRVMPFPVTFLALKSRKPTLSL
jgi:hypothetical protein